MLTGTNSAESVDVTGGAYAAIPMATPAVATAQTTYPAVSAQPHYSQPGQAAPPTAAASYQYQPAPVTATVIPVHYPPAQPAAVQPTPVVSTSSSNSNRQTPVNYNETTSTAQVTQATRTTSGAFPALPSSFPELEKMSVIQLQRLLNDDVTLEVRVGFDVDICYVE